MFDAPGPERPEEEEAVNLSPLRLDPARHEALAARIESAAGPALARRAASGARVGIGGGDRALESLLELLALNLRPALVGAAAAVVLAFGLTRSGTTVSQSQGDVVAATVLAPSSEIATSTQPTWIVEQQAPTDADLAQAIGFELNAGGNP